jgi:hypothetical protein
MESETEDEDKSALTCVGVRITAILDEEAFARFDGWAAGRNLTCDEALHSLVNKGLNAQHPYVLQERAHATDEWRTIQRYECVGEALDARDRELADEPRWLPKGRHRVVDMNEGKIIEWETHTLCESCGAAMKADAGCYR